MDIVKNFDVKIYRGCTHYDSMVVSNEKLFEEIAEYISTISHDEKATKVLNCIKFYIYSFDLDNDKTIKHMLTLKINVVNNSLTFSLFGDHSDNKRERKIAILSLEEWDEDIFLASFDGGDYKDQLQIDQLIEDECMSIIIKSRR